MSDAKSAAKQLEEIAQKLLDRIDVSGFVPAPEDIAAILEDPPAPPLASFPLVTKEGREGFLWAFFHHHYRHGLLMAVQHVWASLARPKAVRCQIMAQRLKLPGAGKTALKNVLAAFLEETLYGVEFPPLPNLSDYPDSAIWNAACMQHFADIDAKFDAIISRYEAILDGREPGGVKQERNVIKGPWISQAKHESPP